MQSITSQQLQFTALSEAFTAETSISRFPTPEDFFAYLGLFNPKLYQEIAEKFNRCLSNLQLIDGIDKPPQILIDPSLAGSFVGGYFNDQQPDTVFINPDILLSGDESLLMHVLQHETYHYCGVYEESITDYLTTLTLQENGYSQVHTGYDHLVSEMDNQLKIGNPDMLKRLINLDNPLITLTNFFDHLFVAPRFQALDSPQAIFDILRQNWRLVRVLFPRLLNEITKSSRSLADQETDVQPEHELMRQIYMELYSRYVGVRLERYAGVPIET